MKKVVLFFALALLCGCAKKGNPTPVFGQEDDYCVEFLFEADGVKVYRFRDAGRYVYFTNTVGKVEYTKIYSNGKTHYKEEVETICNKSE